MIDKELAIQEILEKRGSTLLLISADDLKKTIKETVSEARRILETEVVNGKGEFLLTTNEVLDRLSISRKTLYNWEKRNYLSPIEIGGKKRFKLSDVNGILKNGRIDHYSFLNDNGVYTMTDVK
jgi:predicted DNA-binding transcriptional regulator AlpA